MEFNFVYALNYLIAIAWIFSVAYSLIRLRSMERLNSTTRALWAAVIVLAPIAGAIAFLLMVGKQET